MSNAYIYHHNDDDGYCAGAIIYKYLIKFIYDEIHIQKIDYARILDLSEIKEDDEVYFVDYSFSNEENIKALKELVERMDTGMIYWYDHHKSSKELLDKWEKEGDPIIKSKNLHHCINTEYCGAMLCYWECLNEMGTTKSNYENQAPEFIKYIDSHDTWKHNMPDTPEFHIGMMFKNNDITKYFDEIITESGDIFNWEVDLTRKFVLNCISKGKAIKPYQEIQNKKITKSLGYPFVLITMDSRYPIMNKINSVLKEYNCFAVNGFGNSTVFGELIHDYDMVFLFNYDGEQYKYSIYSVKDDIDCSEIAKRLGEETGLGGGGHKCAAGFQSKNSLFSKNEKYVSKKCIYPEEHCDRYHVKLMKGCLEDAGKFMRNVKKDERILELMERKQLYGESISISRLEFLKYGELDQQRICTIDLQNICFRILSIDDSIMIDDEGNGTVYGIIEICDTVNGRLLEKALINEEEVNFVPRYFGTKSPNIIQKLVTVDWVH